VPHHQNKSRVGREYLKLWFGSRAQPVQRYPRALPSLHHIELPLHYTPLPIRDAAIFDGCNSYHNGSDGSPQYSVMVQPRCESLPRHTKIVVYASYGGGFVSM